MCRSISKKKKLNSILMSFLNLAVFLLCESRFIFVQSDIRFEFVEIISMLLLFSFIRLKNIFSDMSNLKILVSSQRNTRIVFIIAFMEITDISSSSWNHFEIIICVINNINVSHYIVLVKPCFPILFTFIHITDYRPLRAKY